MFELRADLLTGHPVHVHSQTVQRGVGRPIATFIAHKLGQVRRDLRDVVDAPLNIASIRTSRFDLRAFEPGDNIVAALADPLGR